MGYLPSLGTFASRDPEGTQYQDGMDLYQFVRDNPIRWVDPTGHAIHMYPPGRIPGRKSPWCNDLCFDLRARIVKKSLEIENEFAKFDPVSDAAGSPPGWTGKPWNPGGHRTEIENLQRGLKNDLQAFYDHCGGKGKTPDFERDWKNAFRPIPTAPQPVAAPSPTPNPAPMPNPPIPAPIPIPEPMPTPIPIEPIPIEPIPIPFPI